MADFFAHVDALLATTTIRIERPAGTAHPRFPAAVYPVDYGDLTGTMSDDGAPLDVFVGTSSGRGAVAAVLTCDPGKRDIETKVLIDCDPAEIEVVLGFLGTALGLGVRLVPR